MGLGRFRFGDFILDLDQRQLRRDGAIVELSGRYLDALSLLVREHGRLVSKDVFLQEVWRGVPVTDEALTQCVRTIRRHLGDSATDPRFIETVPKHGYRFIGGVEAVQDQPADPQPAFTARRLALARVMILGGAGAGGGASAGAVGGLFYGLIAAAAPTQGAAGAFSVLLVLLSVTTLVALIGGAGVAFGIAATTLGSGRLGRWSPLGAATGGFLVGGLVKLLGLDAFSLLFGRSPSEMTGAPEGSLLGGGVGLGVWLAVLVATRVSLRAAITTAAAIGGCAGALVPLLGGRLMGGSLDLLSDFPGSRLSFGALGAVFGETGLGPVSQVVTGGLEGALFAAFIAWAMLIADRRMTATPVGRM